MDFVPADNCFINKHFDTYETVGYSAKNGEIAEISDNNHENIVQLDGTNDMLLLDNPPTPTVSNIQGHNHIPSFAVKKASFTLHRGKQVKSLRKDAAATDLEVVINSNGENVNIYCNLGFYTKVAIPAFGHLSAGSTLYDGDIAVICHDVTERKDATGAATTTVIMYRLYQQNHSVGQVTVHLHHTTRNVQLQGSALIGDNMKAPVWFVKNLLKKRFDQLAESQSQDIKDFNKAVVDMISSQLSQSQTNIKGVCGGCQRNFNGRSVPEHCSHCSLYYHKYKCYQSQNHPCYTKRRSVSLSDTTNLTPVPPPTSSTHPAVFRLPANSSRSIIHIPPAVPAPINHTPLEDHHDSAPTTSPQPGGSGMRTLPATQNNLPSPSIPSYPQVPTGDQPGNLQAQGYQDQPPAHKQQNHAIVPAIPNQTGVQPSRPTSGSLAVPPITSVTHVPQSSLNPGAAPFVSCSSGPRDTSGTSKKGKTKKAPANNGEGLALEYAKYEVNVTQTKMRELEIKNKDLSFHNTILEARVADLETKQKQDIYDRYFPMPGSNNPEQSNQHPQEPEKSCHGSSCCHHHVHPCRYQPRCCQGCNSAAVAPPKECEKSNDTLEKIETLEKDIKDLKHKIDVLTDVTIPQMIRLALSNAAQTIQDTETQQGPPSTQPGERTDNNADQDMNDVSCHTIDDDDDAPDITEDLN